MLTKPYWREKDTYDWLAGQRPTNSPRHFSSEMHETDLDFLSGARQVSQKKLSLLSKYSVAISFYCSKYKSLSLSFQRSVLCKLC